MVSEHPWLEPHPRSPRGWTTWEDIDVDDGEGVRADVDDDVHAEKRHAQLRAELFDERGHGLGAGRRKVGHPFIQLGGAMRTPRQSEAFTNVGAAVFQVSALTAVRSELDSGLDTWWLLKKMVFLSGGGAS